MPDLVIPDAGTVVVADHGYCSLAELKNEKGITDTIDDSTLQISINAASRQIDGVCGQRFWLDATATPRLFQPTSLGYLDLTDQPGEDAAGIGDTTGLLIELDSGDTGVYSTSLTLDTDFYLDPVNAASGSPALPYTAVRLSGLNYWFNPSAYGRSTIQITAKFGWPAVPDAVKKACLIQAGMLAKSGSVPFGFSQVGDDGVPARVSASLHPLARALISSSPYSRPAVG